LLAAAAAIFVVATVSVPRLLVACQDLPHAIRESFERLK
jgi:hypothetical protein